MHSLGGQSARGKVAAASPTMVSQTNIVRVIVVTCAPVLTQLINTRHHSKLVIGSSAREQLLIVLSVRRNVQRHVARAQALLGGLWQGHALQPTHLQALQ